MITQAKNPNMDIWDQSQATDPKYTKGFNKTGFRGTAINATYVARRLTELFGPAGIGWGIEVLEENMLQGGPVVVDGKNLGATTIIHCLRCKLWYMQDGKRGEIVQFGQTAFVSGDKRGVVTDEEAPKKSLTDAMTKCASLLGIGADIHLGLFDDNKYVNDVTQRFADEPKGQTNGNSRNHQPFGREATPEQAKQIAYAHTLKTITDHIPQIDTKDKWNRTMKRIETLFADGCITEGDKNEFATRMADQLEKLPKGEPLPA